MIVDAGQFNLTRGLPKTGQVSIFIGGDDGTYQAGWWLRRNSTNNKQRFLILTISGAEVVLDRATGLMWPRDVTGTGGNGGATLTWSNAITWANALSFAGFNDWRLPNVFEFLSLLCFNNALAPLPVYSLIFQNFVAWRTFWTCTTQPQTTSNAIRVDISNTSASGGAKTNSYYVLAVRKCV